VKGVAGSRGWLSALLVGVTVWLGPASLRAAEQERSYSLAYAAPSGCPERSAVLTAIVTRARLASLRDGDADLAFDVQIVAAGELASGMLNVRFRTGERFEREVPPAPCEDVTTSMAIMAGLLLSGALLPEPAPESSEPAVEAKVEAAPPPPAVPVDARPAPAPPASSERREEPKPPMRLRAGVFLDGRLDFAVAPFPAFGVGGGLDALLERDSWFSPSVRVGVVYVTGSASEPPLGGARLALRAVTLRACPLRLALGAPFAFYGCGWFEGGLLTVSPRSTPGAAEDASMTWLGLGGAGRLEAAVGRHVALEAELGAFGLVQHDQFVVQPGDVNVYTVPRFSGAFSLGAVARWP
jgi:hypothetical protein